MGAPFGAGRRHNVLRGNGAWAGSDSRNGVAARVWPGPGLTWWGA